MGGILNKALYGVLALLAVAAALGLAHYHGRALGAAECEQRWQARMNKDLTRAREDERRAQELADALGRRIHEEVAKIRIEHKTVKEVIRDEIREVPVYSECRVSDRVLQALNQHRAAADAGIAGRDN